MSKLELSATQVKSLQDQMDSLENRLAKLEEWLQGNITYYNSQIKNLKILFNDGAAGMGKLFFKIVLFVVFLGLIIYVLLFNQNLIYAMNNDYEMEGQAGF